jgi:hypothetical protein
MPAECIEGNFYQFKARAKGKEIGQLIPREKARILVSRGDDVYTLTRRDAKKFTDTILKKIGDFEFRRRIGNYGAFQPVTGVECGRVFCGEPRHSVESGESEAESEE